MKYSRISINQKNCIPFEFQLIEVPLYLYLSSSLSKYFEQHVPSKNRYSEKTNYANLKFNEVLDKKIKILYTY